MTSPYVGLVIGVATFGTLYLNQAGQLPSSPAEHAALEGVGAVVHLAGEGIGNRRWNEAHKAKVKDSRTRGTSLLAETLTERVRSAAPNVQVVDSRFEPVVGALFLALELAGVAIDAALLELFSKDESLQRWLRLARAIWS